MGACITNVASDVEHGTLLHKTQHWRAPLTIAATKGVAKGATSQGSPADKALLRALQLHHKQKMASFKEDAVYKAGQPLLAKERETMITEVTNRARAGWEDPGWCDPTDMELLKYFRWTGTGVLKPPTSCKITELTIGSLAAYTANKTLLFIGTSMRALRSDIRMCTPRLTSDMLRLQATASPAICTGQW
jgi:hypothetical protein